MPGPVVPTGTLVVYSDVGCPWASLAVHRLFRTRADLGLTDAVRLDHRAFPLELVNQRATPKPTLAAEVVVVGAAEPELRWRVWPAPDWTWPVSTLLALEAVQAAKSPAVGGLPASEALDRALRQAFYAQGRTISLHHEVIAVAEGCPNLDVNALDAALRRGQARAAVFEQWEAAEECGVRGSPHLFLPDGTDLHNPGLTVSWTGEKGAGFPRIDADDPAVYADLLRRAAG